MYMSDEEIRISYTQAADRKNQIVVLADLNATDTNKMQEKLRELGLLAEEQPPQRKKGPAVKFDPERAEELYGKGMNDTEIGKEMGFSSWRVGEWRKEKNLPIHRKKREYPKPESIDELRAMELYREGLCDLDMAEKLGCSKSRVTAWRKMMRLKANVKKKEDTTHLMHDHTDTSSSQPTADSFPSREALDGRTESSAPTEEDMEEEKKEITTEAQEPEEETPTEGMSAEALLEILQRLHNEYYRSLAMDLRKRSEDKNLAMEVRQDMQNGADAILELLRKTKAENSIFIKS